MLAAVRGAVRVWGGAAARVWDNLPRLIAVNVLWVVAAWPLLTLGAATLGTYAWLRRAVLEIEDERSARAPADPPVPEERLQTLPRFLRRLWWPGTLWAGVNLLGLFVLFSHFSLAQARAGTLTGAGLLVLGVYLTWFGLALQPFLLDALSEGMSLPRALSEAVRIVLAYPLYAHLCALPPLALGALGWWFRSLWPLVGVAALLLYWAHVATGEAAPRRRPRAQDLV